MVPSRQARCHAEVIVNAGGEPLVTPAPAGYGPSDLLNAYGLTTQAASTGATQTIAIVDAYDDPNAEADLGVYRSQYGLSPCTTANGCFRKVDQRGGTAYPRADGGWAQEISLDVDMASAICPNCKILLVEADSNAFSDLVAAVDRAATLGATQISNSYGGNEYSGETTDESHYNHPGIAVTVSSGDAGYGVEFPASSRYVTAVGGTNLQPNAGNARGWSETAWSGAGSGCSALRAQAGLADRQRLRPSHGRRRLRRRRPEHGRGRLRQLRLPRQQRLDGVRRHQRRRADRRRLRRAGRLGGRRAVVPVRQRFVLQRRHVREQRQLRRQLPVHRQGRLRRADGRGHASGRLARGRQAHRDDAGGDFGRRHHCHGERQREPQRRSDDLPLRLRDDDGVRVQHVGHERRIGHERCGRVGRSDRPRCEHHVPLPAGCGECRRDDDRVGPDVHDGSGAVGDDVGRVVGRWTRARR